MLKINALNQTFNPGHINEVHALRDINLHLPPAQFVTVIGSNGAGKSTIFNAIAGVFQPTQGSIHIDSTDVTKWPEHRRAALVGRVFQDPMLGTAASMSIAQNLSLALLRDKRLRLRSGVTPARKKIFYDLLAPLNLGLEKRLDARVSLLSGGQRQALTLLMAVFARPKVLLLDEHTAALDPATAVKILALTQQVIAEQNLTTLMITHNMQQALTYGDRTLMLDSGQIVLDINAKEKETMTVQDMINKFSEVKQEELLDDELLLSV